MASGDAFLPRPHGVPIRGAHERITDNVRRPPAGFRIVQGDDVASIPPVDGDTLVYVSATGLWTPQGSGGITTGHGPPVGTPTATGLYEDIDNGALYQAMFDGASFFWVCLGGYSPVVEAGTQQGIDSRGFIALVSGTGAGLTDTGGQSGTGNSANWSYGDGSGDGSQFFYVQTGSTGQFELRFRADGRLAQQTTAAYNTDPATGAPINNSVTSSPASTFPRLDTLSPVGTITASHIPTVALVTATSAQIHLTRDVETYTPVTFNPTGVAAATCRVRISPPPAAGTFQDLFTETVPATAVAGDVRGIKVRVPAGWYLLLDVVNAVLGTTTYY